MAKGEVLIKGDLNAALQSFVNAVTYLGGTVSSMNPTRPVEFSVSRTGGFSGGFGAPYNGTATLVPTANNHTKVLIELKPKLWYTSLAILACFVVLAIAGAATQEQEAVMGLSVLLVLVTAATMYLYYVPWPQKVIERIQMGVHGAVPAYDFATGAQPAAAVQPGAHVHPSAPPPPAAAFEPGNAVPVSDQLRQLAELHKQGLITEAEFETKRADILKRL